MVNENFKQAYLDKFKDAFKQAHALEPGDRIAVHYGEPCATVVAKVTGDDETVVIMVIPNREPVRHTKAE